MSWYKKKAEDFKERKKDTQRRDLYQASGLDPNKAYGSEFYIRSQGERSRFLTLRQAKKHKEEYEKRSALSIQDINNIFDREIYNMEKNFFFGFPKLEKKEDKEKSSHKIDMINERNKELGHED